MSKSLCDTVHVLFHLLCFGPLSNILQIMCDKYRLPFVKSFKCEPKAQCYEVLTFPSPV